MAELYQIWDNRDKCTVGPKSTDVKRLRRRVDKLDSQYGGYRYSVQNVSQNEILMPLTFTRSFAEKYGF